MKLTAGSRLGPYEILAPLGAGGMGEVYRARDTRLGREVALKILPAEMAADPGRQQRFEHEARAVSALNHPNIISIHDIGLENGVSFMVTELVDGESLRPLIARGPVSVRKLIEVAAQIADGLAAAHAAGIVHRDLKPENIMLTREGRVKILDFGLAKQTTSISASDATLTMGHTEPGTIMGTVGYMSPEQIRGATLDSRSDLFNLGVIVHEMLTGKPTFAGETSADVLRAILREDAPDLPAAVPPGLAHIVAHCLEKEPQSRFQSTYDLAFGLRAVSGGAIAPAVKLSTPKGYVRWAAFAALAFVAIAAAFLLVGRFNKTEPPRYQRLTFRRGFIDSARFAPEGRSIVYGAAWDGNKSELYSTRIDIPESRPLGIGETSVAAISSSGEMALVSNQGSSSNANFFGGLLARVPLSGGAPREMLKDVLFADWSPDGAEIAVVRIVSGRKRVEFPIGKVIHETSDRVGSMRVSPTGGQVCLAERGEGMGSKWRILVVDRQGETRVVSQGLLGEELFLGWASPREIWYEMGTFASTALQAVTMEGRIRLLQRAIAPIRLLDISREGRVLVKRENWRAAIVRGGGSDNVERDYSWLDASEVEDVSRDRRRILITEYGEGGGIDKWSVYVRNLDGSPAVRLGEGQAFAFSPDGAQALTMRRGAPPELVALPTGAGEPYVFRNDGIVDYGWADWLPDGTAIVFAGSETGHGNRLFVQDLKGGKARPFSPEGIYVRLGNHPISPDGRTVVALSPSYKETVYPLPGGEPHPIPGLNFDDEAIRWDRDGRFIYMLRAKRPSSQSTIYRVEAATGRMQVWKEIAPADPAGVTGIYAAQIASDDRSYFYSYIRRLSDLYVIEGLK